jgi:hypothetical protein
VAARAVAVVASIRCAPITAASATESAHTPMNNGPAGPFFAGVNPHRKHHRSR